MKAHTHSYFILQQMLAQVVGEAGNNALAKIKLTDDFIAPLRLAGSPVPLANLFRLLLPNVLASGKCVHVTARPLLQTGKDILLEFSVAHSKEPGAPQSKACIAHAPGFIMEAERAINDLGGRSERIQLSNAGGGIKFILKSGWLPQDLQTAGKGGNRLGGRRVVIAEDNEVNAKALSDLFGSFGMEADIAVDGNEAIDLLTQRGAYDLVLLDLDMPHMNGVEAARFIRKKLKSKMPIIGLSAAPFAEEELSYKNTGLNHCIPKSSTCRVVPELLSSLLEKADEVICRNKTGRLLTQWSEYRFVEPYKHTTFIHQHGPAL